MAQQQRGAIEICIQRVFGDQMPNVEPMPYFIGRQVFSWATHAPNTVWIETEICQLLSLDDGRQVVYRRYLLTLLWDPASQHDHMAPDLEPQSALTRLQLHPVELEPLNRVADLEKLSAEDRHFLSSHWPEVLSCLQQGAEEMVTDLSEAGGGWDDEGFPARVQMTGAYTIRRISPMHGGFNVHLAFQQQPWASPVTPEDWPYVLQDGLLEWNDGRFTFELWTTSVPL
ncbi:hypothetical protein K7W42_12745 [Deinococcus sp. HMF7604]|uniref:hypothetical protein n=1 Tax=Deinococcus betulae TaxID=2873312 RepID=UPI001CC9F69B|nr:hypothetical protein [Deinococcus betulae]MBZ9751729.1 hypothetical protein [Deinococcus betulae]